MYSHKYLLILLCLFLFLLKFDHLLFKVPQISLLLFELIFRLIKFEVLLWNLLLKQALLYREILALLFKQLFGDFELLDLNPQILSLIDLQILILFQKRRAIIQILD